MSEKNFYDEEGKVICQICEKTFNFINASHLKFHKTTIEKYRKRFKDAPICSVEFIKKSKFGKNELFKEQLKIEDDLVLFEEVVVDEPKIETISLVQLEEEEKKLNPIAATRLKILDWLRFYLPNVTQNYTIVEKNPVGITELHMLTDYCDPYLRIVVEFPETFWHHRDTTNLSRNSRLRNYGWRVIEIPGNSPSYEDIQKYLSNM